MIDLSFLTEEEQKTIVAVLKRDAELKKAEEKRIQNLKKTVADKSKLKYLTGEWFYQSKHLRHQEYIDPSDIIRASMRRTFKPQTVVKDSHTVPEKSSFVTSTKTEAFVLPAHSEEPILQHSTEGNQIHNLHESLSDAPKVELPLPMKVRKNPFNSENTFEEKKHQLVDDEAEKLNLSQNQSSDENPVISALARLSLRTMSSSKSVENLTSKTALSPSTSNTMKSSFSVQSLQQEKYQADWDNPLENTWKSSSSISKSSRSSRMASMSSISSSTSTIFILDSEVQGSIQFAVNYIQKVEEFQVFVVHCRGLAIADTKKNSSDPYVKCYLVPDKTQLGKRKTTVKKKTLNPTYNEVLKFKINLEELRKQSLNVSVWHNGLFGRNGFLGDVDLNLSEWDFNNTEINEYALKAQVPKEIFGRLDLGLNENRGKMRVALKFVLQTVKSKKNKRTDAGELLIWVKDCKDLPQVRGVILNPFLKCTVLPDTSRKSRQKTRVVKKTANPLFNHTMMYDGFKPEDLGEACAEITVWDRNRLHNHFIGGVRLGPGTGKSYGVEVPWMDSTTNEANLWSRMLQSNEEWVEDILPLRMLIMAKSM